MDEWRIIPTYPKYEISIYGDVVNLRTGRVVKGRSDREGYLMVALYDNQMRMKNQKIHRLVYATFTEEDITGLEINHLNCDVTDNRLSNLEACDRSRNVQYAYDLGRRNENLPVRCLETGEAYRSMSEAARATGMTVGHVHMQIRGIVPHAKGYHFELISRQEVFNGRG